MPAWSSFAKRWVVPQVAREDRGGEAELDRIRPVQLDERMAPYERPPKKLRKLRPLYENDQFLADGYDRWFTFIERFRDVTTGHYIVDADNGYRLTPFPSAAGPAEPVPGLALRPRVWNEHDAKPVGVDERDAVCLPVRVCRLDGLSADALAYLAYCVRTAEVEDEQAIRVRDRPGMFAARRELEMRFRPRSTPRRPRRTHRDL